MALKMFPISLSFEGLKGSREREGLWHCLSSWRLFDDEESETFDMLLDSLSITNRVALMNSMKGLAASLGLKEKIFFLFTLLFCCSLFIMILSSHFETKVQAHQGCMLVFNE
jgi:hypothetical protein